MVHEPNDTARTAEPQDGAEEEQRRQAVRALGQLPWPEKRDPLLRALGDESWRVRKEAVEALLNAPVDEETVETLIEFLDTQGNAGVRNAAVELLQVVGTQSLATLCHHLTDPRPGVRKFIVDILGGIGDADAVPYLIEHLADPDPNVQAAVAESLGIIADPRAVGPLLAVLGSGSILVSCAVLDALVRIGQPLPLTTFEELVRDPLLKKGVFTSLGALCGEEAAPFLINGLHEPGKSVRESAITGLMNLRNRLAPERRHRLIDGALRRLVGTPCVEQAIQSLDSADPTIQKAAATILGLIGDARAVAPLSAAYRSEQLRQNCLEALASIGSLDASVLIGSYADADIEARCLITFVCGELGLNDAEPLFRDGMHASFPELRFVAAQGAGKAGLLTLAGEIVALLDDEDSQVSRGALEALSRFAKNAREEMAGIIASLVASTSPAKRFYGVQLLSSSNQPEGLLLLAKDPDPKVRRMAISALAEMGAAESVSSILMALADEDDDVRTAAATALGELGGEEVREPLLLMLQDHSPWVCRAAVKSLVFHRFREAFDPLSALVHDGPGMVRIAALEGVAQLDRDRAVPYLVEALADPDSEMLRTAVQILTLQEGGRASEQGRTLFSHPDAAVRMRIASAVASCLGRDARPLLTDALAEESDPAARDHLQHLVSSL